ncbi:16S rRNA (cytosine(967)-C(5))-methyltransferase RsmB [Atopobacter phocae]|uniref:16S rRNA (cytosine(967)-C(5))-methyltransferase RsmB n=1 Tax=Atopobacter phocae TaxID=136492 RepID=UPI000472944C|nr:16S rRNA (cytosine(967)-C(5))-methyltransferase RsmB [Atopobacter phocae]
MSNETYNIRYLALQLLLNSLYGDEKANEELMQLRKKYALIDADERLLQQLVYGVMKHHYELRDLLKTWTTGKQLKNWVWLVLELAVYQRVFLDKIPDHAIVNEAVESAKKMGSPGIAKLINAILRQMLTSDIQRMSYRNRNKDWVRQYSMPMPVINRFIEQWGKDETHQLLESIQKDPKLSLRLTDQTLDRMTLINELLNAGFQVEASKVSPLGIISLDGKIFQSDAFKAGKLIVQDESSQQVVEHFNFNGSEKVLDACAAPGGKTTHLSQRLPQGEVWSNEVNENKIEIIKENIHHLKQTNVTVLNSDARYLSSALQQASEGDSLFDAILVDAPCSGLGLMRRKVDIRYHISNQQIEELTKIQQAILDEMVDLLQPGGELIYSTCTLTREENQEQVASFLKRHPQFKIAPIKETNMTKSLTEEGFLEILPHHYGTDGFFIAKMIKE